MTSLPIQVLWTTLATLILTVCGVNLMGPNTIGGFPPTAYYLISSIASFLSIVLPFSFFLFFGKRKLSDTVLVEKNGVLNSVLLVFAGLAVSVLMNIPANLISQLLEGVGLNGDANHGRPFGDDARAGADDVRFGRARRAGDGGICVPQRDDGLSCAAGVTGPR